ncbi:NADPH-dependent FMN reductase [Suicoccus acidiformans]|uniref:NADPH-dependent FMN reductase n=1 Tax=Suicoccus acidiformans TaxID=2036206 RepID=A0A347WJX6_9LACT|nr:NADPH-dependent FMN reductase [Suicoccus acidiformans]AXY25383.1 NADPH-dependent FMN reductase [Suicoccus acidiformans]
MKLIGIVGTNASKSYNRDLLHFIQRHFADKADIEVVEIKDIPAFQTNEDHTAPEVVMELAEKIAAADGVIISTPEYDHTIPAPLKSVIEWMSYVAKPFINKPVMITGASLGSLGSSRAQLHLRQILDAPELKARVLSGTEFLLGRATSAFDDEGNLQDSDKVQELEDHFEEFTTLIEVSQEIDSRRSQNA